MYTFEQLEQAEKFALEILNYKGFQDVIAEEHLNFWVDEITRIEQAKRFHDDVEILLATQATIYDPWEGIPSVNTY